MCLYQVQLNSSGLQLYYKDICTTITKWFGSYSNSWESDKMAKRKQQNLNSGKYISILSNEFVTDIFLLKLLTLIYLNAVLSTFKHLSNVIYLQSFSVQNLRLVQIKTTVHWFCDSFTIVNIVKVYFTSIIYCISQSADSFPRLNNWLFTILCYRWESIIRVLVRPEWAEIWLSTSPLKY